MGSVRRDREDEKIREERRKFRRSDRVGASKERKKKRNPGDRIGSEQVFKEGGNYHLGMLY
jgi:hypothetical protein